jgi:hypothetical protein
MRSIAPTSAGDRLLVVCTMIPVRARRPGVGTVTSTQTFVPGMKPRA